MSLAEQTDPAEMKATRSRIRQLTEKWQLPSLFKTDQVIDEGSGGQMRRSDLRSYHGPAVSTVTRKSCGNAAPRSNAHRAGYTLRIGSMATALWRTVQRTPKKRLSLH